MENIWFGVICSYTLLNLQYLVATVLALYESREEILIGVTPVPQWTNNAMPPKRCVLKTVKKKRLKILSFPISILSNSLNIECPVFRQEVIFLENTGSYLKIVNVLLIYKLGNITLWGLINRLHDFEKFFLKVFYDHFAYIWLYFPNTTIKSIMYNKIMVASPDTEREFESTNLLLSKVLLDLLSDRHATSWQT